MQEDRVPYDPRSPALDAARFVPIFESSDVDFQVLASAYGSRGMSSASHSISLVGRVSLEMTGIASCLLFRQQLGRRIAREIVDQVSRVLRAN